MDSHDKSVTPAIVASRRSGRCVGTGSLMMFDVFSSLEGEEGPHFSGKVVDSITTQ